MTSLPKNIWKNPVDECDLVMKGGITSGVIYPLAIAKFGERYRFRGVGGASAGAIGAALAAAAEHGRAKNGFGKLQQIPDQLTDGALGRLFQAQPKTRVLLKVATAAIDGVGPAGKVAGIISALARGLPAALVGLIPGLLLAVGTVFWLVSTVGLVPDAKRVLLIVGAVLLALGCLVLAVLGWAILVAGRLGTTLTRDLPANEFGICRGLQSDGEGPAFTEWLSTTFNDLAGLDPDDAPLTFGRLWRSRRGLRDARARAVDLRVVATCLNRTRPYEMPWESRNFFFDPRVWAALFPENVMKQLAYHDASSGTDADQTATEARAENAAAAELGLVRLPAAYDLPVIVAVRMSLSLPLLISAIPLHSVVRTDSVVRNDSVVPNDSVVRNEMSGPIRFEPLWFNDGGLCSNFPIHLFESPLPTRPTFAINLGSFAQDSDQNETDERQNVQYAPQNSSGARPAYRSIAPTGSQAIVDFLLAMMDTSRSWQDNSYLTMPGYRDRIVRVLQTSKQGGLNLNMPTAEVKRLAARGKAAASVMIEQFTEPRYRVGKPGQGTGWDNHRWVRYRALMAAMPDFLTAYRRGERALDADPAVDRNSPPSLPLRSQPARELVADINAGLLNTNDAASSATAGAHTAVTSTPNPPSTLKRVARL